MRCAMKRVVIFGSTGNTGLCSLRTAVEKGLKVRAFVRDKTKIPEDLKDKVEAFIGDVTNAKEVAKAVADTNAVVVVLGTRQDLNPTTVLSQGMRNIVHAMKTHNVGLVSVCLSEFLFDSAAPVIFQDVVDEHQRMLDIIKSSDLKWVAICPRAIAEMPKKEYTITFDVHSKPGVIISKYDLGAFLVECLEKPDYYQKIIGISNTAYLW
ncbi:flavin reductase (NADPH)-like isoform X2 [Monomorium pharaonis]|uniref:flavin reductase (NADPH)-like isoform X2 n=1 Tax=Monomorium pharaonis TaxID=307658 RepID=UPI001746F4AC|nr:flavin reductase (NADPH)-like isoform X2 [Monomorium pharaonis]